MIEAAHDDGSLYPIILATLVLSWLVSTACTAACLAAKRRMEGSWQKRDGVLVAAWLSLAGYNGLFLQQARWGVGAHTAQFPVASNFGALLLLNWASSILWLVAMALGKTALILRFIALLCPTRRGGHAYTAWLALAVFNVLWPATCLILFVVLSCVPPGVEIWMAMAGESVDVVVAATGIARVSLAASVLNVVSDIILLLAPLRTISRLQMTAKRKVEMAAYFGFGLIACVASITRLVYHIVLTLAWSTDIEYMNGQLLLWSTAELTVVLVCACFPLVPSLWTKISAKRQTAAMSQQIRRGALDGYRNSKRISTANNLAAVDEYPVIAVVQTLPVSEIERKDEMTEVTSTIGGGEVERIGFDRVSGQREDSRNYQRNQV